MKNKILELNSIYSPSLSLANEVLKLLHSRHVDSALNYRDNICSNIDGELVCRNYPIPVITCRLHNYKIQIGLDLVTTANYLGFIKFTLTKDETLKFNFNYLNNYDYTVYSTYNYQSFNFKNIKEAKKEIIASNSCEFRIKIDITSLNQIEVIINRMTKKPNGFFSSASYTCICGSHITINAQNGKCPVCNKESSFKRAYKSYKCPVCKNSCLKDQYGNGKCNNCGWVFDSLVSKKKNKVIYPNLISLNKAIHLYKENKPFEPDIDEFVEALFGYGEMQFEYNRIYYTVELIGENEDNPNIKLSNSNTGESLIFKTSEDFKNRAKIEGKLLKNIWDETTDRYWLQ